MKNYRPLIVLILALQFDSSCAQTCNCTIYPVQKGCEKECGLWLAQHGTAEQLQDNLKITKVTAGKIVQDHNRSRYKSIESFKDVLPYNNYLNLEEQFNKYTSNIVIQNNNSGNNINGDQIVGTQFVGNPYVLINNPNIDSIKFEIEKVKKTIRINLGHYYINGCELRDRCRIDSLYKPLEAQCNKWYGEVLAYLSTNLDYSYVAQFQVPKIGLPLAFNLRNEFANLFEGINNRVSILFDFITTLR